MTTNIRVGAVDVFVFRGAGEELRVLGLRRARGTRCTGAWEIVHGRIEDSERPEDAAVREVREETGLAVDRLYNVTSQAFYLHRENTVLIAVVFAAFVSADAAVRMGGEHDRSEWWTASQAAELLSWPRSRATLRDAVGLVGQGTAGAMEDVLRVR